MKRDEGNTGGRRGNRWSGLIWGAAACLLLLPLLAMQFTDEVDWDAADFIAMGVMLAAACSSYELAARVAASPAYRAGAGIAVVTAFVLVWINLAVGIFGNEDHPANLMFGGVLVVGLLGVAVARLRATGMAWALAATAFAQGAVAIYALIAGFGTSVLLAASFVVPWLASAGLFRKAARDSSGQ